MPGSNPRTRSVTGSGGRTYRIVPRYYCLGNSVPTLGFDTVRFSQLGKEDGKVKKGGDRPCRGSLTEIESDSVWTSVVELLDQKKIGRSTSAKVGALPRFHENAVERRCTTSVMGKVCRL